MTPRKNSFHAGQLIIYVNGDTYKIGKIKRIMDDGAFVWYHEGDTASKTPFEYMHALSNAYVIDKNSLGGEDAKSFFNDVNDLCYGDYIGQS